MLTGDIEKQVERQLIAEQYEKLDSTIVVIPHHGSNTSSTADFVRAVDADLALNSSGYLNRYRFPAKAVRQRWLTTGSEFLDTAIEGSVVIDLDETGQLLDVGTYLGAHGKYWHWRRVAANLPE